jgi:anti-sigma-K factor RskA
MQNRHIDDLVGAYVLGALEADAVDLVERHLEECEVCRALVSKGRRSAELLLYAVPQVAPPPSLRSRVLARIAEEKVATSRSDLPPREDSESHTPTPELESEPSLGPFRRLLHALRSESAPVGYTGAMLRDLLADPQCAIWQVAGTDAAPGAYARLVASPRRHVGVLVASGLRHPGAGKAYQVWLLRGGQPLPNALFTVNRAGAGAGIVSTDEPWRAFDTLAVTPEPEGGSPAPTGSIVLAGSLVEQAS